MCYPRCLGWQPNVTFKNEHSGGLAFLWKSVHSVTLIDSSFWFIDVLVNVAYLGEWRFTGFYGRPNRNERRESWGLLKDFARQHDYPWLCCGDFNSILGQHEKKGGKLQPNFLMQDFREGIIEAGVSDLPMSGYPFTWDNGREGDDWVEAKLDRFLANDAWRSRFAQSKAAVVEYSSSDHLPIFLQVRLYLPRSASRIFRFENSWCLENGCREIVKNIWSDPNISGVLDRLQLCSSRLSSWGEELRRFHQADIDSCKSRLRLLRGRRDVANWDSGLENVINGYFRNIFSSQSSSASSIISELFPPMISEEQNVDLMRDYTKEEVREVVFSMQAEKSPGLDGFNPGFYRKYWDLIGDQVSDFCVECLRSGSFPVELNETAIVLIPKKEKVEYMTELRPIALCKVLYKVISKMVANRLKHLLPFIISGSQCAFVPGRHIQENTVIAFETLHFMKGKRRGKDAYDRLEWNFLKAVLLKLGFDYEFVSLVYFCVSTVSFKGDPLSPYHFILCMEGLSRLIQSKIENQSLEGIAICRGAPIVSHLSNVRNEVRSLVCDILQVQEHDNLGFYLGLPTSIGRKKAEVFQYVKDKFWKRLNSWKNKALSKAGKEILIKSVLQSLPTYVMNLFLLPKGICEDLHQMMARFWWGTTDNGGRKIHWLSWARLARHKHFGGLSFKNIRHYNIAMLGKMGWHLFSNSSSLVSRILKARYFPEVPFLQAPLGTNPSYTWRSIRDAYKVQMRKTVVSTVDRAFWKNLWAIKAAPKAKNLIWRAASGSLPCRSLLRARHVPISEVCPMCNIEAESVKHLLVDCTFAQQVWQASTWLSRALALFNPKDVAALMYTCWSIWEERNYVVWKNSAPNVLACYFRSVRWRQEWEEAQISPNGLFNPPVRVVSPQNWQKPSTNWLKLNVDIATSSSGWIGVGMVVLNEEGGFVAARIFRVTGSFTSLIAEAMGVREALSWIKMKNWTNVIVESDNLQVIQAITGDTEEDLSMFGDGVAHALAQATRLYPYVLEWTSIPPDFVLPLLF
ncbi:hypothetical protein K2173_016888 [Erythroxylum novogranatense]|uniref:Reverse transcriptase domain-containing protein n=1 Tax=Erythroxylum novogranatense TaxID=1862640 RepID=A0AAV8U538_9ROSI|nr:hypothetical protein K2173_016888 [Erythroxylum novogranatense]